MTATPPWATGSGTTGFTAPVMPPPATPAEPLSTNSPRAPHEGGRQKRTGIVTLLLTVLVVVLVAAAGWLAWQALAPEDVAAPVPEGFEVPAGEPTGPTGAEPVSVGDTAMTTADMAPNTMFIPALGVYMPVAEDATFVESRYRDFQTLKLPDDAGKAAHFAGGAGMAGGDVGTTLVAAHVSTARGWGALRYLYTLSGGELVHTKDAEGQLQTWQVRKLRVENHTDFPQEYWSAEGERQLVVVTCGGTMRSGKYDKNIFAIAVPVDPEPVVDEASAGA